MMINYTCIKRGVIFAALITTSAFIIGLFLPITAQSANPGTRPGAKITMPKQSSPNVTGQIRAGGQVNPVRAIGSEPKTKTGHKQNRNQNRSRNQNRNQNGDSNRNKNDTGKNLVENHGRTHEFMMTDNPSAGHRFDLYRPEKRGENDLKIRDSDEQ